MARRHKQKLYHKSLCSIKTCRFCERHCIRLLQRGIPRNYHTIQHWHWAQSPQRLYVYNIELSEFSEPKASVDLRNQSRITLKWSLTQSTKCADRVSPLRRPLLTPKTICVTKACLLKTLKRRRKVCIFIYSLTSIDKLFMDPKCYKIVCYVVRETVCKITNWVCVCFKKKYW